MRSADAESTLPDREAAAAAEDEEEEFEEAELGGGGHEEEQLSFPPVVRSIILCEFCERLAYYGVGGNLVLFLQTRMGMSNAEADIQYSVWTSLCYITPLLGGYIADTRWGRYNTILFFSSIYVLGLLLTVAAAYPRSGGQAPSITLLFIGLYTIALGTGGIKPNVSTLGADQLDGLVAEAADDGDTSNPMTQQLPSPVQSQDSGINSGRNSGNSGGSAAAAAAATTTAAITGHTGRLRIETAGIAYGVVGSGSSHSSDDDGGKNAGGKSNPMPSLPLSPRSSPRAAALSRIVQLKKTFFLWFYFSINLGALVAYTALSYVCQFGLEGLGGESMAFFWGYLVPLLAMAAALWIFAGARGQLLRNSGPDKSEMDSLLGVVREAAWRGLARACGWASGRAGDNDGGSSGSSNGGGQSSLVEMTSRQRGALSEGAAFSTPTGLLDLAKSRFGGSFSASQVEGVKLLARLVPFLSVLVLFWAVYSQLSVGFQNQACQMDLSLGEAVIPISALNLFDTLAILLFVPLLDRYVYPALQRRGVHLTSLGKVQIGFVLAALAMVSAGMVEQARRAAAPTAARGGAGTYLTQSAIKHASPCVELSDYSPARFEQYWQQQHNMLAMPAAGPGGALLGGSSGQVAAPGIGLPTALFIDAPAHCVQTCNHTYMLPPVLGSSPGGLSLNITCIHCAPLPQTADVSILLQVPQFLLVGLSEVFCSVSALEFFYAQCPAAFRSSLSSLNLLTTALGSLVVIPLILAVNAGPDKWITPDLDDGHLDRFFFLLAALMVANLAVLRWFSAGFVYHSEEEILQQVQRHRRGGLRVGRGGW